MHPRRLGVLVVMGGCPANIDLPTGETPPGALLLERFEVVRKLGAGKFSTVYLVKDLEHGGKQFALKLLNPEFLDHLQANQGLRNEILNSKRIETSHVVKVISPVCSSDQIGALFQYAGTRTFKSLVQESTELPLEKIVSYLIQGCSGLSAVHASGLVHRDLKPGCFLIGDDGIVRLIGLGLSKPLDQLEHAEQDPLQGNVGYASPEFLTEGKLDRRSDIYALGLIAYELVAKRFPFNGESALEVVKQRLTSDAAPLCSINPQCPVSLSDIVERAMSRNPDNRYESVLELELALRDSLSTFSQAEEVVPAESVQEQPTSILKERLNAIRSGKIIYAAGAFGQESSFESDQERSKAELSTVQTATFEVERKSQGTKASDFLSLLKGVTTLKQRRVFAGGAIALAIAALCSPYLFSGSSGNIPQTRITSWPSEAITTPQFAPLSKEQSHRDKLLRKGVILPEVAAPQVLAQPEMDTPEVKPKAKLEISSVSKPAAAASDGAKKLEGQTLTKEQSKVTESAPKSKPTLSARPKVALSPELQRMKEEAEAIRAKMYGPHLPESMR